MVKALGSIRDPLHAELVCVTNSALENGAKWSKIGSTSSTSIKQKARKHSAYGLSKKNLINNLAERAGLPPFHSGDPQVGRLKTETMSVRFAH
jgi:hypothetical protein